MTKPATNKWYAFVPNMFTSFNLVCGVIAIYFAFNYEIKTAVYLMIAGAFFDFIDGFMARLLKVSGELGKQLDSLADMITFGLLPGVLIFTVQHNLLFKNASEYQQFSILHWIYFFSPILIPVFSAIRLAKFNIDTRQTNTFVGVPTPANALFFASLSWTLTYDNNFITAHLSLPLIISILIVIFSFLMNAELPLFALKFKSFKFKENIIRYVFIVSSLLLLVIFKIPGILAAVFLYLLLSLIVTINNK